MKSVFKQLILDFHSIEIAQPIDRLVSLPDLPTGVNKAITLVGVRRSGKTWTLYQVMADLRKASNNQIQKQQLLYLNFEDDRLMGLAGDRLHELLEAYFELYPELATEPSPPIYLFLDEIQVVDGWEKFVRRLLDTTSYRIFLSGSSAKMLSKEIATSLRGRTLTREIFPFSFSEYLKVYGLSSQQRLTSKQKAQCVYYFGQYLERGGFPETLKADQRLHQELIQSYVETVIFRDIIERHGLTNILAVRRFFQSVLNHVGGLFSINKLYQSFKSQGLAVSKNALYEYLTYFEDAYCLFSVPLFSFSEQQRMINPVKIYPVDPGMITAYTLKTNFEQASRLETVVFGHLRRSIEQVYYYKTASGKEVDFLIQTMPGVLESIQLFQVCVDLSDPKTRARETSALEEAMQTLGIKHSKILVLDGEEDIKVSSGVIQVQSVWIFLLEQIGKN